MPNDAFFKAANLVHKTALKLTGGRFGASFGGMPILELVTTGRRSGQKRSVMLTSPVQEGDTIVIVASKGGEDTHPAWLLNLRENPDVEVAFKGGPRRPMRARMADADERSRLWPQVTAAYSGYANYQKRTSREIPLVLLEPRS